MVLILSYISFILLQTINPQVAVENISNSGLIGSFFILFVAMTITLALIIKKALFKFLEKINEERVEYNKEADRMRQNFIDYLVQKNDVFVEVIKNYSDSNDNLKVVLEKILMKM